MKTLLTSIALGAAAIGLAACDQNTAEDQSADTLDQQPDGMSMPADQTTVPMTVPADDTGTGADGMDPSTELPVGTPTDPAPNDAGGVTDPPAERPDDQPQ